MDAERRAAGALLREARITTGRNPMGTDAEHDEAVTEARAIGTTRPEAVRPISYGAFIEGKVIGAATTHPNPQMLGALAGQGIPLDRVLHATSLTQMAVRSAWRCHGVGARLVDALRGAAADAGFSMVYGLAEGDLDRLRRFYQSCGFTTGAIGGSAPEAVFGDLAQHFIEKRRHGFYFWGAAR